MLAVYSWCRRCSRLVAGWAPHTTRIGLGSCVQCWRPDTSTKQHSKDGDVKFVQVQCSVGALPGAHLACHAPPAVACQSVAAACRPCACARPAGSRNPPFVQPSPCLPPCLPPSLPLTPQELALEDCANVWWLRFALDYWGTLLAIGTARGRVLVFDPCEAQVRGGRAGDKSRGRRARTQMESGVL